jgi:tetratricopeptide (TPR) repeat protein
MMTTNRMIYGLRAAVYGLCCAALLLALGGPARAFEYNPLPDSLMNVSLPVGQQELYAIASTTLGDGVEDAPVQACQDLMAHPEATPELKRWAALREVHLHMVAGREEKAVAVARRWLAANPNHMLAQRVRAKVAEMLVSRMPDEDFKPTPAEAEAAYAEVFAHGWQEPLVTADARSRYAMWLDTLQDRRADAIAVLDDAIAELQAYIDSPVSVPVPLAEGMSLLDRGEWLARDQENRKWASDNLDKLNAQWDMLVNFRDRPEVRAQIERAREDTIRMIEEQNAAMQAESAVQELVGE